MDEHRAEFARHLSHDARCQRIDLRSQLDLFFSPIDIRIGGGIDDQVWLQLIDFFPDRITITKIQFFAIHTDEFSQDGQDALELPAELSVFTKKKDFHSWA